MADTLTGSFSGVNPTQTLRAKNAAAKAASQAPATAPYPPVPSATPVVNAPIVQNPNDTLTGNFSGVNPTQTLRAQNQAKAQAQAPVPAPAAPVAQAPQAVAQPKNPATDPTSIYYVPPTQQATQAQPPQAQPKSTATVGKYTFGDQGVDYNTVFTQEDIAAKRARGYSEAEIQRSANNFIAGTDYYKYLPEYGGNAAMWSSIGGGTSATQPPTTQTQQPAAPNQQVPAQTGAEPAKPTTLRAQNGGKSAPSGVSGVNYDTSIGRENEITQNLAAGLAQSPALFVNRDTFNKAYGYATADAGKKAIMDAFFESNQPKGDVGSIYNALRAGQPITPQVQNTQNYAAAKAKFDMFNRYSGQNSEQLLSALKNNEIGSELGMQLLGNPAFGQAKAKYQQYLNTKSINETNAALSSGMSDKGKTVTPTVPEKMEELSSKISTSLESKGIDPVSFKDYIASNPEITSKAAELTSKTAEYKKIRDQRDKILEDTKKEYPGMPLSTQLALAAKRSAPLTEQLKSMSYDIEQISSDLKYKTDLAEKDYEYQYKTAQDARDFAQAKELAAYQAQLGLKTDQAKFEQQLAQKAQMANDPVLATQEIIDTYAKMGVLPERSAQEIIQSVKNDIAGGMTLAQSLTNLNKAFQSKQSYKDAIAKQAGAKTSEFKVIGKDAAGNDVYGFVNAATQTVTPAVSGIPASGDLRSYASQYPNEASLKNNNPAGITYNETFAKTLEKAGIQYSKGTARPANEGGNYFSFPDIQEGFKAYDLLWSSPSYQNLTVGAALNRWGTGSLPGVDTSKKVSDLTDAERRTLQMAQIKKESPGMFKVLTSAGTGQKTVTSGARTYDEGDLSVLGSIEKLDATSKKVLAENGLTTKDWAMFKDGQLPPTESQKMQANKIVTTIDQLLTHPGFNEAVGSGFYKSIGLAKDDKFPSGTDAAAFKAEFDNLVSNLTLPNLGMLKGAMSDKDIEFLRSAGSSLSLSTTEEQFKKSIGDLKEKYRSIIAKSSGGSSGPQASASGAGTVNYGGKTYTLTK